MSTPGIVSVDLTELNIRKWTHNLQLMFLPTRGSPTLVQALPGPSIQVTAGSNHTVVLLMDGQVFTFGSFSVRKALCLIKLPTALSECRILV